MPTVLLTGASRGLGLEFSRQYAAAGWRVLATCRRPEQARQLASLARDHAGCSVHRLDVTDLPAIEALAAQLAATPIDVLLNNAGAFGSTEITSRGGKRHVFGHTDPADWLELFRVNVIGPMKMAEAFLQHVAASRQRKIVTVSSSLGSLTLNRIGGWYPYRSSKAAVNAVVRSMAVDLARRGIIAVAVNPGWVRTTLGGPKAELSPEQSVTGLRAVIAALVPADRGRFIAWDGSDVPW